jgi:hypothetical protein
MRIGRWIGIVTLLAMSAALVAQTETQSATNAATSSTSISPEPDHSSGKALGTTMDGQGSVDSTRVAAETNQLDKSREAGLLTDWHLEGRFGHGNGNEFAHKFPPEREATKEATRRFVRRRYELVFAEGTFALPEEFASQKGVFYANSSTYLTSSGEWNVFLESGAEAMVFIDGRRVLAGGSKASGVLRAKIHVESGYHSVMVKFTAQAAPFRVAILPLNSGSRRKNNTPYLQASPASEDMMAFYCGTGAQAGAE